MVRMNKELDWAWCEPYFENEPIPELQVKQQYFLPEKLTII